MYVLSLYLGLEFRHLVQMMEVLLHVEVGHLVQDVGLEELHLK